MEFSTINSIASHRGRLARQILSLTNQPRPLTPSERARLQELTRAIDADDADLRSEAQRKHDRAFSDYVRHGAKRTLVLGEKEIPALRGCSAESLTVLEANDRELRDMGVGPSGAAYPGSTSAFFVSAQFSNRVEEALKYYGPMLDVATPLDTPKGAPLFWPTSNDVANVGELLSEGQQATGADPVLNQVQFDTFRFSSKICKVSWEFLTDSAIDVESYLARIFGVCLGRIMNQKFTTGTGSGEPLGIVTATTSTVPALGSASNDGSGGANSIGSDDLSNLEKSLDPSYRPGALFMMHPNTLTALRSVKTKDGSTYVFPGLQQGEPEIFGYGVRVNRDMATLQSVAGSPPTTVKSVLFGQLGKYVVRKMPMMLNRFDELYADAAQTGFLATQRCDGRLLDAGTHPTCALVCTF